MGDQPLDKVNAGPGQRSVLTLGGRERRDEVRAFVRKHHYSRSCPGVWSVAYALENARGKLQAVLLYGEPPYPSVKAAFVRDPALRPRVAWQARMVAAGITVAELDALIGYANRDLERRGFWWVYTLTEPTAHVVESTLARIICPGFTGEVYHRNQFMFLGHTGRAPLRAWRIDGVLKHPRQGPVTLTRANVHQHFPTARTCEPIYGHAKQRWAYVLGDARERAQRVLLICFRPQPWEAAVQPRLLARVLGGWRQKGEDAQIDGRATGATAGAV